MRTKSVAILIAGVGLLAAAAQGDTTLEVTPGAALGGSNWGLEIQFDGNSVNNAYVQDNSPAAESVYRFGFRASLDTVTGFDSAEGDIFYIATARSGAPNNLIRVWMRKRTDGSGLYQLRMICRRDSGSNDNRWHQIGGAGIFGDAAWTFEWVQASAPGADDGACRVLKNGVLRGENTAIDADERTVEDVRIGLTNTINVSGTIDTSTTGTYYMDTFESFRTLAP